MQISWGNQLLKFFLVYMFTEYFYLGKFIQTQLNCPLKPKMCNKLICFTTLISWIISRVTANVNLAHNTEAADICSNIAWNVHMHTERNIFQAHIHIFAWIETTKGRMGFKQVETEGQLLWFALWKEGSFRYI